MPERPWRQPASHADAGRVMTERAANSSKADEPKKPRKLPAPAPGPLDGPEFAGLGLEVGAVLGTVPGDPRLSGRATAAQRIAVTRHLQGTRGNAHVARVIAVQRELASTPERLSAGRVRIEIAGIATSSFADFQGDVSSGIALLVARANLASVMSDTRFLEQLREYHGSLLGAPPDLRNVTLEVAVDRSGARPTASIAMATNPQTGELEAFEATVVEAAAPGGSGETGAPESTEAEALPPPTLEAEATAAGTGGEVTSLPAGGAEPAGPMETSSPREGVAVRIPLNEAVGELPPMPYGVFLITTRMRVRGALVARAAGSVAARWARLNAVDRQLEAYHTFQNEVGQAQFELTPSGCTIQLMGNSINLAVRISGNVLEFVAPARPFSATMGEVTFDGTFGLSLAFEVNGNPAAVEALLAALATSAEIGAVLGGITAAGAAVARFGTALGEAVNAALRAFAMGASGFLPVVLPGAEEMLEEQRRRFEGGGPGGLSA